MDAVDHYDAVGAGDARSRKSGPAFEMKRFHNAQKQRLLEEFVPVGAKVLDLACGRGGDVWKFAKLQARVVGVDVSEQELEEARRRARDAKVPEFEAVQRDARVPFDLERKFDAVTCFFALHYFWESEDTAHAFFANVSRHLAAGGVFVGIVPDGRCIRDMSTNNYAIRTESAPTCFGSAYTMAIADTVLAGAQVREYRVFSNVLEKVAAAHGLVAIPIPWLTRLDGRVLWHFDPPYEGDWRDLTLIYGAFAFRKKSVA